MCEDLHLPTHTLTRVDTRSSLHKLTLTTIFMSPYFLSEFALTNLHSVTQVAIQPHVALPSLPHFLSADTSTIKLGANAGREQRTFTPGSCTGRGKVGRGARTPKRPLHVILLPVDRFLDNRCRVPPAIIMHSVKTWTTLQYFCYVSLLATKQDCLTHKHINRHTYKYTDIQHKYEHTNN